MSAPEQQQAPGSAGTVIPFPVRRRHNEPWLNKRQLAQYLGYSTRWVEYRVRDGMPNTRFGSQRRFRVSEVEAWLAARRRA